MQKNCRFSIAFCYRVIPQIFLKLHSNNYKIIRKFACFIRIYVSRFIQFFVSIVLYKLKISKRTVTNRLSHQLLPNYNSALTIQSSKGILIRFHHLVSYILVFPSNPFSPQFEYLRKLKVLPT